MHVDNGNWKKSCDAKLRAAHSTRSEKHAVFVQVHTAAVFDRRRQRLLHEALFLELVTLQPYQPNIASLRAHEVDNKPRNAHLVRLAQELPQADRRFLEELYRAPEVADHAEGASLVRAH